MMSTARNILLAVTTISSFSLPAFAAEEGEPLSLSVNAGFESDSNITVDAIDTTSNVGDEAFVFDGSADYKFVDDKQYGFSAGYNFYMNRHQDLDAFDMTLHGINLDGRYTVSDVDLGLAYSFNAVRLGGNSFLDMNTIRPNIGYLTAGNKVYLLGSYEYQKQKFKQTALIGRNATRNSGSIKAIYLMGKGRTITGGYTYLDHKTDQLAYAYTGHVIEISTKLPVDFMQRETTVRAGYKLQSRDYDDASLLYDTVVRSDTRHTLSASWQVPIKNGFSAKGEFEHIKSNSTYAPVDYSENIWTLTIGWEY